MAEFLETPRFPACFSYGYTSTPIYDVTKIRTAGGQEDRNAPTEQPLVVIEGTVGPRKEEDVQDLLEFYHAMGGERVGFRVKNEADYKSCAVHETISATDQPLVEADLSDGTWQLVKRYTRGAKTTELDILKPVDGTILIAADGDLLVEDTDYSIDYTTGIVTLLGTVSGSLTWGGEFDLPMRFDGEFPVTIVSSRIESVSFRLVQLRRP